ncbi:MAG: cell division protein FtsH [Mariniblastus sp.]
MTKQQNEKKKAKQEKEDTPAADLPTQLDLSLLATAYHEAGHAVMAAIVGRPVQKVTIAPAQMQTGGVRLGAVRFKKGRSKPAKDWLEDEVLIQLAGMVAESHLTDHYCDQGASSDLRNVRRLLESRANNERQLEKLERRMLDKTEYLLSDEAHAKAIKMIAHELIEKESISGRAVQHLLNMAIQQK